MNTTVLNNGLRIISEKISYFKMVHLQFRYLVGSGYDYKNKWGIAHLLEHMLFRGDSEFINKMAEYGAVYYAETDIYQTIIYLDVPIENFYKSLKLILQMISNINFTEEGLMLEKLAILNEIDIINNDSYLYGVQEFYYNILGDCGHPILGDRNSIENINIDDLKKFFNQFYTSNNIIVGVAGDIEHDKIVGLISKYYYNSIISKKIYCDNIEIKNISRHIEYQSDLIQVFWGWNAPEKYTRESYIFNVLTTIFSGDGTNLWARLFKKCRTELGLTYMIGGIINDFYKNSIYIVNSCTDLENFDILIESFNREIECLSYGIKESEIRQSKAMIISELLSNHDNLQEIVNHIINKTIYKKENLSLNEEIDFIKNVNNSELLDVFQRYLYTKSNSLITIGKLQN